MQRFKNILCVIDPEEDGNKIALERALILAEKTGKLIDFLKPEKHLIKGFPSKVIPEFAQKIDADLVVMGTIGRTGIPGLIIGNTAEDILNQIHCSVLAVKPADFVSPVTLKK